MHAQHCRGLEWRVPPSKCCAASICRLVSRQAQLATSIRSSGATQDRPVVHVPGSREEALNVSVAALLGQIKPLKGAKKTKKGFGSNSGSGSSGTRFSIELPLPGDSPADVAAFTADILARLPAAAAAEACIVYAAEQAAAAAAAAGSVKRGAALLSLRAACQAASLSGPLVLVEPTTADVALVEQLLDDVWRGSWVLVLNPTWHTNTPPAYQELVDSFDAVYSFMPIATQGLMRAEGAVLRQVAGGSSGASPWRVLLKEGDQFVQVGQMKKRPAQSDLELVFMNARAASSPLTSLVKGVKGMLDRKK